MTQRLFAILRYTTVVALIASLFLVSACDDDDGPTKTIYQLISEDPSLSMIKAQIDLNADMKAKLEGAGTYTLYAPNDLAMNAILTTLGLPNFALISPSVLNTVLNYHLVNSVVNTTDMTNGAAITTAQGENITIEVTSAGTIKLKTGATTSGTVVSSIAATNGVLHVVGDYPLIPPSIGAVIVATLGKVAQPILLLSDFTTLAAGIQKADAGKAPSATIVGAMVGLTSQTFFAIPNAVFTAASITADTYTAAQWDAIIRGHLVPNETIGTLAAGTKNTINAKVITTTSTTVQGAGNANAIPVVTASKITMSNGTIFPIQGILLHP
jgi:uncharacterized surface protein with fasciclin (FAS1) repeats